MEPGALVSSQHFVLWWESGLVYSGSLHPREVLRLAQWNGDHGLRGTVQLRGMDSSGTGAIG